MAEHGENYVRMVNEDTGAEIGVLGTTCGHHCGVVTVGNAKQLIRHCNCVECHNKNPKENSQ